MRVHGGGKASTRLAPTERTDVSFSASERALKETLSHFLLVPLGQWEYGKSEKAVVTSEIVDACVPRKRSRAPDAAIISPVTNAAVPVEVAAATGAPTTVDAATALATRPAMSLAREIPIAV